MTSPKSNTATLPFLSGGGISGELIRSIDWSSTPLGPADRWPPSLQALVSMMLHSRHPMFLWWGPELIQFYNDAYLPTFGNGKHPAAMGQRGRECWQEIWPIIWPQIDDAMTWRISSWNEDHLVPFFRNDRIEEGYWTYGYSPVFDESGAASGTLVVCTETTSRVLADRRSRVIRLLGEKGAWAIDSPSLIRSALDAMTEAPADIPFALVYARDPKTGELSAVGSTGLPDDATWQTADARVRPWVLTFAGSAASERRCPIAIESTGLPGGSWPEPSSSIYVVPLLTSPTGRADGFIVFGLSPRLPFDDAYRNYLEQLVDQISLGRARIEAFKAHSAAESERNNLLSQAPVAIAILTGPRHVFELANPLYCQMVGRDDLLGKAFEDAFPGTRTFEILDRVYRTGEPFSAKEYRAPLERLPDGQLEQRFFTFNLEPLRDANGSVYGMIAVISEISEQVRSRKALEKVNAERAKLVEELEAAGRAKDEFLAMLGHELRNPLSPIVTALQLMKLRGDADTTREQEVIERQIDHLIRLVDDLLDVSKITRGKIELRKETLEIAEAVAKAVEMASFLFEQRRHRLSIEVPRAGLRVLGDPVRLAQVVANLLTNAARYTPPGGDIRLTARSENGEVVIRVLDNGVGIPSEILPQVFDLFVQGKRGTDRAEGGLGLGLTLVKTLVALHGGSVVARSGGTGQGSEFVIRLPIAPAVSAQHAAGAERRAPSTVVPRRILLVDDNVDAADLLADALRSAGHEVEVANDPVVALAAAERFEPAVAILDIGLPVMDGYELAARMKARPALSGCRLISLTGYGQEHDRARSRAAGFQSHLVKPARVEDIMKAVAGPPPG